jgi:hypothetical protein
MTLFVQNDPDLPNWFFTLLIHFKRLYTKILLTAVSQHQGRKKQGHSVQGDYEHFEKQTLFPNQSIWFRSILYKG